MKHYKFWKNIYENNENHWYETGVNMIAKDFIKKYPKFYNILEIGCAEGVDSIYFAKQGYAVTGIDIIDIPLKEANKYKSENLRFEIGDAENLKYKDQSFDRVYSVGVLHSTDIYKSMKEINRVLKSNGICLILLFIGDNKETVKLSKFMKAVENNRFMIDELYMNQDNDHIRLICYLKKGDLKNE